MSRILTIAAAAALCVSGLSSQDRIIQLTSAPALGNTLKLEMRVPASSIGNTFFLVAGAHTDQVTQFPAATGILGDFFLDSNLIVVRIQGPLQASNVLPFLMPTDLALLGIIVDIQFGDATATTVTLSDNEVVATIVSGIGATMVGSGSTTASIGRSLQGVVDLNMGDPLALTPKNWDTNKKLHTVGPRGWVQGYNAGTWSDFRVDMNIHKQDRVMQDCRDSLIPVIALPNGRNFLLVNDAASTKDYTALTIDRGLGTITELTGSTATTSSTSSSDPGNTYDDWWAFSADGSVAIGVLDYASTSAGPSDKVVMMQTDNSNWPSTFSATLDITPAGVVSTTWGGGKIIVANQVVFVYNSSGALYWAPLNGSAILAPVTLPTTGTGQAISFMQPRSYRVSADGSTVALPVGTSTSANHDLIAIRNIDNTGTFSVSTSPPLL